MTRLTIEQTLAVNTLRNSGSPLRSLNEAVGAETPFVWDI
jgi:hypothetical protein